MWMKDNEGNDETGIHGDDADSIPVVSRGKYWRMMVAGYVLLNIAYLLNYFFIKPIKELFDGMQIEYSPLIVSFIYSAFSPDKSYLFVFPLLSGVLLYAIHKYCKARRLLNYMLPIILLSVSIAFLISTLILWGYLSPLTQLCAGLK